jgi:predicted DNA-binding transcriptional regulator AlpA
MMKPQSNPEPSNTTQTMTNDNDWISKAIETGRMLSSKEVAAMLGYKSRCSFWGWVRKAQPPHVRVSARNVRFPAASLKAWLESKSNKQGVL